MDNYSQTNTLSYAVKSHPINTFYRLVGTIFCYLIFGLFAPLLSISLALFNFIPIKKASKRYWTRTAISGSCRLFINTMSSLRLLSYSIKPAPQISTSGKLIIANHPSLLDALFILSMCKNLCCITKSALWKNPFTASIVRMADYIPNDCNDFITEAKKRLLRGENILIFPEGTRNHYDDQLDFKRGAANIAILSQCNIIPVIIKCSPRAMQKGEKFYSLPIVAPHFFFDVLSTIEIKKHINNDSSKTLQYRRLTHYLVELYRLHLTKTK